MFEAKEDAVSDNEELGEPVVEMLPLSEYDAVAKDVADGDEDADEV